VKAQGALAKTGDSQGILRISHSAEARDRPHLATYDSLLSVFGVHSMLHALCSLRFLLAPLTPCALHLTSFLGIP
jgi:hypothetical protein